MSSEATKAPCATDGTDFRGAVKGHYREALMRFVKFFPAFFLVWVQLFVFQAEWLLPLGIVGFFGALWTLMLCSTRLVWIRKSSRVFRAYPLRFRAPVEKVDRDRATTLHFCFGPKDSPSPTMRAKDVLGRPGWPADITAGVWFAGDDPFGGAAIVPGAGEILFMQPKDWELFADERNNAGEERIRTARRGGIKSPSRFR